VVALISFGDVQVRFYFTLRGSKMAGKLKKLIAAVIAGTATSAALALPAVSTVFTSGVTNTLSDDFVEYFFDNDSDGKLSVGDVLFTTLAVTSYAPNATPASSVNELTAISAIEITGATSIPDIACSGGFSSPAGGCAGFTFGATTLGFSYWLDQVALTLGVSLPSSTLAYDADTVAIFVEGSVHDFTTANPAGAFDGDTRLVVDLLESNGDFWSAVGPDTLIDFLANPIGAGIGSFSLDLTIVGQDFAGWDLGSDITGRGTLSQAPSGSASPIGGDASFFTNIERIPEPATLALVGVALLGAGFGVRRSKKAV
jgi:PEP-CTERM motif